MLFILTFNYHLLFGLNDGIVIRTRPIVVHSWRTFIQMLLVNALLLLIPFLVKDRIEFG